ncbi:hypothetical protein EJG51_012945 [Undibacterium piscinae]|uniref:Uncharacterized protein n=1 Tax=Undibacterium piscinae TaxID=2495591 RepID=A0A6M4A6N6_9BURK|nr:hypothetical protein EJG51_012945 [Undibacterium piscinae]
MNLADKINLAVAITGGCSAAISLFVAIVTYQMQGEPRNRRCHEGTTRRLHSPVHSGDTCRPGYEYHAHAVDKKCGGSSAKNLRLSLDKDFYFNAHPDEDDNLRKYTTFVHPIQSLSPQAEMVFYLGVGHNIFRDSERCPQQFTVQAEYEYQDNRVVESTTIDLQPFRKSAKPVDPIVEQLENISGHLSEIRSAVSRSDA